jgi:hypothetical protein
MSEAGFRVDPRPEAFTCSELLKFGLRAGTSSLPCELRLVAARPTVAHTGVTISSSA